MTSREWKSKASRPGDLMPEPAVLTTERRGLYTLNTHFFHGESILREQFCILRKTHLFSSEEECF